jgi:predicted RNA-binding protein with PIN domain
MTPPEFFKELTISQGQMSDYSEDSPNKDRFLFLRLDSKIREILERWRRDK